MNLTTATARKSTHDGQTAYVTRWTWVLDGEIVLILTHERPHRHGARGNYAASVLHWLESEEEPRVELFSPRVSTQARALEWLNTTGMAALQ